MSNCPFIYYISFLYARLKCLEPLLHHGIYVELHNPMEGKVEFHNSTWTGLCRMR